MTYSPKTGDQILVRDTANFYQGRQAEVRDVIAHLNGAHVSVPTKTGGRVTFFLEARHMQAA